MHVHTYIFVNSVIVWQLFPIKILFYQLFSMLLCDNIKSCTCISFCHDEHQNVIHKEYSRFLNQFSPPHALYHELNMIVYTSDINIKILIHVKLVFANFCFPCGLWSISYVIRWGAASNPDYIPLVDIIQVHFHESFELLIKFGLWLVVNSECCLWSTGWGLPYCANECSHWL